MQILRRHGEREMLPFNSNYIPGEDTSWSMKVSKTVPTFQRGCAQSAFAYIHCISAYKDWRQYPIEE